MKNDNYLTRGNEKSRPCRRQVRNSLLFKRPLSHSLMRTVSNIRETRGFLVVYLYKYAETQPFYCSNHEKVHDMNFQTNS